MCGIGGVFSPGGAKNGAAMIIEDPRFSEALIRRGPDHIARWVSKGDSNGLLHTRLSIVDPTVDSNQPYHSDCGRYIVIFNGEIYNYRELRKKLEQEGIKFQSNGEIEVIAKLFSYYHESSIGMIRGMFAIAIFDLSQDSLLLARDEFGIKPLYYLVDGNRVVFSSLIQPIVNTCPGAKNLNENALFCYFLLGYIAEPSTLYMNVETVDPGSILKFDADGVTTKIKINAGSKNVNDQPTVSSINLAGEVIHEAIGAQCKADVPIALALSAGIDSAILASSMSQYIPKSKRFAITLVFEDQLGTHDSESEGAIRTAQQFGFDHEIVSITREQLTVFFEEYLQIIDQPTFDGFNMWILSKVARDRGFKVLMTGIGADELFSSYKSLTIQFFALFWLLRVYTLIPNKIIKFIPIKIIKRLSAKIFGRMINPSKLDWIDQLSGSPVEIYLFLRSIVSREEAAHLSGTDAWDFLVSGLEVRLQNSTNFAKNRLINQLKILEREMYLRSQLLKVADCSSMANGVEVRVPFVDQYLYSQLTVASGELMHINKQDLANQMFDIPLSTCKRKKTGFVVPSSNKFSQISMMRMDNAAYLKDIFEKFMINVRG